MSGTPGFRTVIFDCDSTLSAIEGIEELAVAHREEIARLTDLAMQGAVPLEEVYGRRLDLIRPSRQEVERIGALYVERLVPGALETVRALQARGAVVQVLSGGVLPAVQVVAAALGIPSDRVAAVDLHFDQDGAYRGYDRDSPLARSGGKRQWMEQQGRNLPRPSLLVGDGATDLEARPAVDCFAAFTGVVHREPVVRGADVTLPGPSLTDVLAIRPRGA
ncbi:MAG: HAD-IB family phosphatase [Gemmatimonadetes bacterium]|nr:HAD-IB family phosphatase [Gemmatimonadota bacterium]MBP6669046.1 HAD-IB family phosphatase [Gemmatimonadales bacterium]MBK6778930.1 HAD-IB family phosphatase [Gemmatimonadota bacterium]MBK7714325.1 HAD-IB family phosphatase [Gemmatimonadota bacterium]MBK7924328.1 HAD-IB family phosphatase [Gemmatimonadota bacterium]